MAFQFKESEKVSTGVKRLVVKQLDKASKELDRFALLRGTLNKLGDNQKDVTEFEALIALIDRRRTELETEAELLGSRLYAEKPSAFVGRLEAYWNSWRSERGMGPIASVGSANPPRNGARPAQ